MRKTPARAGAAGRGARGTEHPVASAPRRTAAGTRGVFGVGAQAARGAAHGAGRISRATLTTQLEEALRTDIVAGLLEPGRKLRAADIAALYGVSPTPIREALQRLSGAGLVELDPKVGARVAAITLDDARDVFAVRLMLEPRALELSIARGDAAWLADVAAALEELRARTATRGGSGDGTRWREAMLESAEAHRAFHWTLLSACGSPWLLRFLSILYGHSARYRMLLVRGRDRPSWVHEHELVLDAARRGDARAAVRVLERHIDAGLDALVRSYGTPRAAAGGTPPSAAPRTPRGAAAGRPLASGREK